MLFKTVDPALAWGQHGSEHMKICVISFFKTYTQICGIYKQCICEKLLVYTFPNCKETWAVSKAIRA